MQGDGEDKHREPCPRGEERAAPGEPQREGGRMDGDQEGGEEQFGHHRRGHDGANARDVRTVIGREIRGADHGEEGIVHDLNAPDETDQVASHHEVSQHDDVMHTRVYPGPTCGQQHEGLSRSGGATSSSTRRQPYPPAAPAARVLVWPGDDARVVLRPYFCRGRDLALVIKGESLLEGTVGAAASCPTCYALACDEHGCDGPAWGRDVGDLCVYHPRAGDRSCLKAAHTDDRVPHHNRCFIQAGTRPVDTLARLHTSPAAPLGQGHRREPQARDLVRQQ